MSINIDYDRYNLRVSVECIEQEGVEVNTSGFLTKLETFLSSLDSFGIVNVHIVTRWEDQQMPAQQPERKMEGSNPGNTPRKYSPLQDTLACSREGIQRGINDREGF